MKKILIVCENMFIGDILFASSVAEALHRQYAPEEILVDYLICLPQPKLLLEQNPFIHKVSLPNDTVDFSAYDSVFHMPIVSQDIVATVQHQRAAKVPENCLQRGYTVYTVPEYDQWAKEKFDDMRNKTPNTPILGVQLNWHDKAYQSTEETLAKGIGAPHRNIKDILEMLTTFAILVPIGFPSGKSSYAPELQNAELYARTASIMKQCDFVVGSEGGISNLSAGCGIPTIITTDFIFQNYSTHGRVRPNKNPQLGPLAYFPDRTDIFFHLAPTVTDAEIPELIKTIVMQGK